MGGLFSKPKVTPAARMPDPNDPAIKEAEERARRAALSRSGRASTVLTPIGDNGGGTGGREAFKNTLLGQS